MKLGVMFSLYIYFLNTNLKAYQRKKSLKGLRHRFQEVTFTCCFTPFLGSKARY